jgi:choline dehydrogenase-like flavoprotein
MKPATIECDLLVIGSGPGGATTACLAAEAGRDVLLVEEGSHHRLTSAEPFSLEEVDQKYRNAGLTPTFGKTAVTYIEGRCVGGGSEINAALCHMPTEQMLEEWASRYRLDEFGARALEPYFEEVKRDLSVSRFPFALDPASIKLKEGSDKMGWASEEVPRFWRYPEVASRENQGVQQSMTETMVPRALAAGCRLLPDTWVKRLKLKRGRACCAEVRTRGPDGRARPQTIRFKEVFVCAGPTQTPTLLQRSGLWGRIGRCFTLHPMIRVVARYDEVINDFTYGVPVQQVVEFKPDITLGCSHSSLPHMAMWLGEKVEDRETKLSEWRKMAVFYVLVKGHARGRVWNLPGFDEALVTYPIDDHDMGELSRGLFLLGQLLFSTGAVEIFSPVAGEGAYRGMADLERVRAGLPQGRMTVSTIHLFSTCAMGGDPGEAVVDSFGKMYGLENVWVNDASVLPDATGVNPQLTVMAVARRNARHFLG